MKLAPHDHYSPVVTTIYGIMTPRYIIAPICHSFHCHLGIHFITLHDTPSLPVLKLLINFQSELEFAETEDHLNDLQTAQGWMICAIRDGYILFAASHFHLYFLPWLRYKLQYKWNDSDILMWQYNDSTSYPGSYMSV